MKGETPRITDLFQALSSLLGCPVQCQSPGVKHKMGVPDATEGTLSCFPRAVLQPGRFPGTGSVSAAL